MSWRLLPARGEALQLPKAEAKAVPLPEVNADARALNWPLEMGPGA